MKTPSITSLTYFISILYDIYIYHVRKEKRFHLLLFGKESGKVVVCAKQKVKATRLIFC